MCPLDIDFEVTKKPLIKKGEHYFLIEDIEVQKPEGKDFEYLHFLLLESDTKEQYKNLLSAPLPKKENYYENSKFSVITSRLGINKEVDDTITYQDLNNVIGKEFSCIVSFEDNGFAKIVENSIVLVAPTPKKTEK